MARFNYLICFAAMLVMLHQSVDALPTRRFGIKARSNTRRTKVARNGPVPAIDSWFDTRAVDAQPVNPKFAKRSVNLLQPVNPKLAKRNTVAFQPVQPKVKRDTVAFKPVQPKAKRSTVDYKPVQPKAKRQAPTPRRNGSVPTMVKRQMEDAPSIYAANLPPSPTTGFWATATANPNLEPLIKAIQNFNNAKFMLKAKDSKVAKRQLIEGQKANGQVASEATKKLPAANFAFVEKPTAIEGAITRTVTQVETLVPTVVTIAQLDQNGYPMGPATTETLYAPMTLAGADAPVPTSSSSAVEPEETSAPADEVDEESTDADVSESLADEETEAQVDTPAEESNEDVTEDEE